MTSRCMRLSQSIIGSLATTKNKVAAGNATNNPLVWCDLIRSNNGIFPLSTNRFFSVYVQYVPDPSARIWPSCHCASVITKRTKTKKAKAKQKAKTHAKIDLSVADGVVDLTKVSKNMLSSVERLKEDFKSKYSPKLSSGTIDKLTVHVNGEKSLLYEVAQVSSTGNEYVIKPMLQGDNVLKELNRSINNTGLNLNPRIDGPVIRITASMATSEYKEDLLKLAKTSVEKSKVHVRKFRQQAFVDLRKEKDNISKDVSRLIEQQIQQLTDVHISEIDEALHCKEQELKS